MKRIKILLVAFLAVICLFPALMPKANAASNPYPTSQTVGGVVTIPCTYYAWQQAYDRLGIALPAWGNAINWYDNAARAGYSVGATPRANSIAVWSSSSHGYGHVAYVTAVNGSQMTVNEGGRTDATANGGIVNGQTLPSTVGVKWYGRTLIGFVYLNGTPSVSASWAEYPDKWSVGSTNAVLSARINLNVDISAVSKVGVYLYDYAGKQLAACSENTSHRGYTFMNMWFDVNSELHYTLKAGTPYKYKFFAVISGKTYESSVKDFKTAGTHSHTLDAGSITKAPTCSATGVKTFTCTTCGATKTETIAKKDHTYKPATCAAPKTCSVCGATSGSSLKHTEQIIPGKAATCTEAGLTEGKKCSVCEKTLTAQQTIPAPGHKPAAAVTENKVAATDTANGSYDTVVYCQQCKKELSREKTVIPAITKATVATKATTATKKPTVPATTKATVVPATTKATAAPATTKATAAPVITMPATTPTVPTQAPIETTEAAEITKAPISPEITTPVTPSEDAEKDPSTTIIAFVALVTIVNIVFFIARKKK